MDFLRSLFDVGAVALRVPGYCMSWLELVSSVLYLISVLLAIRPHLLTWPVGIAANLLLFALFFQIQLYSDMLLQTFYVAVSMWGWCLWWRRSLGRPLEISRLEAREKTIVVVVVAGAIAVLGSTAGRIHLWLPTVFTREASFAYVDATTTVLSIIATVLLVRKKVESWVLWLVVDALCVYLYIAKGILLMAAEYGLFFVMAGVGMMRWQRILAARESNCLEESGG